MQRRQMSDLRLVRRTQMIGLPIPLAVAPHAAGRRWGARLAAALAVAVSLATPERTAACTLTTTGAATVNAGAVFTLTLGAVPGVDGVPTSWTISWGDGAIQTYAGNPASVTHTYTAWATPSIFTYNILASAVCGPRTYFQNDLVVPSANDDKENWYTHSAATNKAVARVPAQSGPNGIISPLEAIVGPDGNVYVSGLGSGNVLRYNTAGTFLGVFATGGTAAAGMAFGPDGHLYVADNGGTVRRYNKTTGAFMGNFIAAGSGINTPEGLKFGPDGNLYVTDFTDSLTGNAVYRYNGSTGAFINKFVASGSGGLKKPEDLTFGPDGNLYVASDTNHNVLRFQGPSGASPGAFMNIFVVNDANQWVKNAQGVAFGPDGNFYVSSFANNNVVRFQGLSGASPGAFIDVYVSASTTPLNKAEYFDFLPGHQVKVVAAFDYVKPITIDRTMIPAGCGTTLANYPMLFSSTDADLARTTSGGKVTDLEGDDIIFRGLDDTTCGGVGLAPCTLDHEIESYTSTAGTGTLVAWVRIPAVKTNDLANASDTVIYMYYGDSTVTSPTQNPTGVWDANFKGVWHLKEVTGAIAVDSTSNPNDATAVNNPVASTGQIGGALTFASLERLTIPLQRLAEPQVAAPPTGRCPPGSGRRPTPAQITRPSTPTANSALRWASASSREQTAE